MSNQVVRKSWVIAFFVLGLTVLWFSRRVVLLLFAGLLMALVLTSMINLLRRIRPIGQRTGLLIVLLILSAALAGVGFLMAPKISDQFSQLAERVPEVFADLRNRIEQSSVYQKVESQLPEAKEMVPDGGVTSFFSSTFEAASAFVFIGFTAIFLAANPRLYRRLLLKLTPPKHREQAEKTTAKSICTLKYWLLGQLIAMTLVGVCTGVALRLAGVPFALALGIVAGFAEFIPILGPIIAAIPALLLALSEGNQTFLVVLGIFGVIQLVEGNIITPIVQRKAVDLPPIITLLALFVLGASFGVLGMFVAAPLAAVTLVLLEDLYLQRYLGTDEQLLT